MRAIVAVFPHEPDEVCLVHADFVQRGLEIVGGHRWLSALAMAARAARIDSLASCAIALP